MKWNDEDMFQSFRKGLSFHSTDPEYPNTESFNMFIQKLEQKKRKERWQSLKNLCLRPFTECFALFAKQRKT